MVEINEDIFKENNSKQYKIEDYLSKDEKVLWHDSPNTTAYTISQVIDLAPMALLWLLIDGGIIAGFLTVGVDFPVYVILFMVVFFAVHLTPVWIWISKFITARKEKCGVVYYITNKRVIITDFERTPEIKQIDLKDISDISLTRRKFDKILKVGDIEIIVDGEEKPIIIHDIKEPEKVYMAIEQIKAKFKNLANISNESFNYTKLTKCKYCGGSVALGKKCPNCGATAVE